MNIELLYQLQELELKEVELQKNLKRIPQYQELKSLKERFESCQKNLQEKKDSLELRSRNLKDLENRATDAEEEQQKLTDSLYDGSIESPKELEALQEKLNTLTGQYEDLQEQLINISEEKDQAEQEISGLTKVLQSLYKEFNQLKGQYNRVKLNLSQELTKLQSDKEALLLEIDEKWILWYQEKKAKFSGSPVGKVTENHACSGCHTIMPMAVLRDARECPGELTCERCGRIIFVPKLPV